MLLFGGGYGHLFSVDILLTFSVAPQSEDIGAKQHQEEEQEPLSVGHHHPDDPIAGPVTSSVETAWFSFVFSQTDLKSETKSVLLIM